ncbi:MAG: hypothetical protein MHPSP_004361, partial [Paramarteilia canceri]
IQCVAKDGSIFYKHKHTSRTQTKQPDEYIPFSMAQSKGNKVSNTSGPDTKLYGYDEERTKMLTSNQEIVMPYTSNVDLQWKKVNLDQKKDDCPVDLGLPEITKDISIQNYLKEMRKSEKNTSNNSYSSDEEPISFNKPLPTLKKSTFAKKGKLRV